MLINKKSPHGADIYIKKVLYDFSANTNAFGMPEHVRNAIISSVSSGEVYPDPYCTELCEKIALYESVETKNVICGNGAAELIYQFVYSLERDKPALIVSPTFCEYETALAAAGIESERYILTREDAFVLTDAILEEIKEKYSSVFICSPNNPTGITVRRELLYSISAKCRENGIRLFCDFCFCDLSDEPDKYSVPDLIGANANVFVLKAFTKSYAMAGIRLGYGLCSDKLFLERMSEKAQCWNVSSVAQSAGIAALDCPGYVESSRIALISERERIKGKLRGLGIEVFDGEANYLLMRLRDNTYGELLHRGILVRDCGNYHGLDNTYIRIAIKKPADNELLISAFREIKNK